MTVRTPHIVKDDRHWLNPPSWWKKFKPLRWLAIATIVVGLGSGFWGAKELVLAPTEHPDTARFLAVEIERLPLGADTFTSYSTLGEVTSQLDAAGVTWRTIRNHAPQSERYPPRDLDTLKADKYQHLGVTGILTLEFFNNRLFEFYFEPKDAFEYAPALHKAQPGIKSNKVGKFESVNGSLRLATNVDLAITDVGLSLRSKPYAVWQDLRLVSQTREWDQNYGSVPLPPR